MLWDTEDMRVAGERNIERDSLRTLGLGVGVSAKALIPPCALILALLLFDLGLFLVLLAFLGFFLRLLNLGPPVFEVQETALVELNLGLVIPLEFDRERGMADDSLVLAAFAVDDLGVAIVCGLGQCCAAGGLQSTNKCPLSSLVIAFLPGFTVVPEFDIAFLPLCFVKGNARDTRLEERDGERQLDLVLTIIDRLQDNSIQLAIFKLECCRVEGVWRNEGARCGDVVCERAIALTEARLVASLEVFMLDGDCSLELAINLE